MDKRKKEKRAQRSTLSHLSLLLPRWAQTLIFYMRIVKRNRSEIEAPKNQISSTQQRKWKKRNKGKEKETRKKRKMKNNNERRMKEKERQWKKMKENERKGKKRKYNEKTMKDNEKWERMKENERQWKKKKEKERHKTKNTKRKLKNEKWKKWKNEKKKKKWKKKNEKIENMKKRKKNEKHEKWKNRKNEKMRKIEKMKKLKNEKNWIHAQNPRRFPGFAVVVVICSTKSKTTSMILFSECVSFPKKINNPFWCHRFSKERWQFPPDVKQKHTFYRRKSTKQKFAKVSFSNIIFLNH